MLTISPDNLPISSAKFPYVVNVQVSWPPSIKHHGKTYYFTDKEAIRTSDGLPCAEYAPRGSSRRAWLGIDRAIVDDP